MYFILRIRGRASGLQFVVKFFVLLLYFIPFVFFWTIQFYFNFIVCLLDFSFPFVKITPNIFQTQFKSLKFSDRFLSCLYSLLTPCLSIHKRKTHKFILYATENGEDWRKTEIWDVKINHPIYKTITICRKTFQDFDWSDILFLVVYMYIRRSIFLYLKSIRVFPLHQ